MKKVLLAIIIVIVISIKCIKAASFEYVTGDWNEDSIVDLVDLVKYRCYAAQMPSVTREFANKSSNKKTILDINGDKNVNMYDLVLMRKKIAGIFDIQTIYTTDLKQQAKPLDLLVILMNYNNATNPWGSDAAAEKAWGDYIFKSGSMNNSTASINDFFKEMSNGKFYFNPVLLGNNTTGVYSYHLNKDYSDDQGLHQIFAGQEFKYDIALAMEDLKSKGLNLSSYAASGINHDNYSQVIFQMYDAPQSYRQSQWYTTSKIMVIFPSFNTEGVDFTPISGDFDKFSLYTHINYDSSFATLAHELVHTLGAIDIYNFGSYGSDLMSDAYPVIHDEYNTIHVDPYYKILYGWVKPGVAKKGDTITLYPQNSSNYKPYIVETNDRNQYFILENRLGSGFDKVNVTDAEGVNVWKIDGLGMDAIYNSERKGMQLESILKNTNQYIDSTIYSNYFNINDTSTKSANMRVTYVKKNTDNSIVVKIN